MVYQEFLPRSRTATEESAFERLARPFDPEGRAFDSWWSADVTGGQWRSVEGCLPRHASLEFSMRAVFTLTPGTEVAPDSHTHGVKQIIVPIESTIRVRT